MNMTPTEINLIKRIASTRGVSEVMDVLREVEAPQMPMNTTAERINAANAKLEKLRYGDFCLDRMDNKVVRFGERTGQGYCTVKDAETGKVLPDERHADDLTLPLWTK